MFPELTRELLDAELKGTRIPTQDAAQYKKTLESYEVRKAMLKCLQTKDSNKIQVRLLHHKKLGFKTSHDHHRNIVEVEEEEGDISSVVNESDPSGSRSARHRASEDIIKAGKSFASKLIIPQDN